MKRLLRTLPSAYLLFHFFLLAFNTTVQKILVIGIVFYYVITNFKRAFDISARKCFVGMVSLICLFVLLTAIVPIMYGTFDFSLARKMLTMYTNLLFWVAFVIRIKKISKIENENVMFTFVKEYSHLGINCIFL